MIIPSETGDVLQRENLFFLRDALVKCTMDEILPGVSTIRNTTDFHCSTSATGASVICLHMLLFLWGILPNK